MYGEGLESVSEGWRQIRDLSTTTDPNISSTVHEEEHFCKLILYKEIQDSRFILKIVQCLSLRYSHQI